MALAVRAESPEPIILAMPEKVTEVMLIALARRNPEYRFETMADGRLVVSPLTGTFANFGEVELLRQLANWNAAGKFGRVTGLTGGITLADGAIKGPDAAFISSERIASLIKGRKKRAFEQIAPDAVFELLSPSDRLPYTEAKCAEYVATGSGVAVLLNPRTRTVTMYRSGCKPVVVANAISVAIGSEMPGFFLAAAAVFDASEVGETS